MVRRPPRSTRTTHSFPTRRSSDLLAYSPLAFGMLSGKYEQGERPAGARITLFSRFARYTNPQSQARSEEHTSELQSLMRISYAVFCVKKKKSHIYKKHNRACEQHENNTTKIKR